MQPKEATLYYPLHPSQLEVYYDQLLDPESPHYNVGGYVVLHGAVHREKLLTAIRDSLQRLDIHQMAFDFSEASPRCYFRDRQEGLTIQEIDFSEEEDAGNKALEWMQERYNIPFDMLGALLYEFAVLKISSEEHILYCRYHHLLTDAYGFTVSLKSVARRYSDLLEGIEDAQEVHNPYRDELANGNDYLSSDRYLKDREYWKERCGEAPAPLLPKRNIKKDKDRSNTLIFDISPGRRSYYTELTASTGISIQQLTIMALYIYFANISSHKDFTVGVEVYKRKKHQWSTAGMFAGILPFKLDYDREETIAELAEKVRSELLIAYRHQHYPVSHINRELKLFRSNREQLFEIYVNYLLLDFDLAFKGLRSSTYELLSEFEKVPFRFWWRDYGMQQGLQLRIDFNTAWMQPFEAAPFVERILHIMDKAGQRLDQRVRDMNVLTEMEDRQIRTTFNKAFFDLPADKTFIDLFEQQATLRPDDVAVVEGNRRMSYRELDEQAGRLANYLKTKGAVEETLVAVCLNRSIEMLVGILATWKASAAYLPIDPEYPSQRINYILDNSKAGLLLTDSRIAPLVPSSRRCEKVLVDELPDLLQQQSAEVTGKYPRPDNLAYVIYTSGSTGNPKGVMIEHKGMLNHLYAKVGELNLDDQSRVLQNASASFDISIWQFVSALLRGGTTVIYSREKILDTGHFLTGLVQDRITHAEVVPSYLRALLEDRNHTALELPDLKYIVVTGETLPPTLASRWLERYASIPLVNAYGPTEASDDITHYQMNALPDYEHIPIGYPVQNMQIYVFSPQMKLCPIGVPGEIGVAGIGVGRGYLNNESLTAEKFIDNPFSPGGKYKLYKTGDNGYWLPNGELGFIGRSDDQVKIRGHRIELGEIERVLLKYPGTSQGVVVAKEDSNGIKRLIAYVIPSPSFAKEVLLAFMKTHLPDYMIPAFVIELEAFPLTANGKIDRAALPDPDASQALANAYAAPRNWMEEHLVALWAKLLNVERVGIHDHFFELGGDSLHATQLVASIRRELRAEITIRDLFTMPTIADLSLYLSAKKDNGVLSDIKPIERPARIPLSFSQERLWFIDRLQGSLHYQVPILLRIRGDLNKAVLENAFTTIVNRHEALRTVFLEDEQGVPYQEVLPRDIWRLSYTDELIEADDIKIKNYLEKSLAVPIDLSADHMIRATLAEIRDKEYLLVIVMHHIASDGWSMPLYVNELKECYQAGASNRTAVLMDLPVQYADYAIWQRTSLGDTLLEPKLQYWEKQLAGIEPLNLPTDHPRPAIQSVKGNTLSFTMEKELHDQLKAMARREGVTLYMLMLAVFKVMLYRYTGQNDICVGSPVANRTHKEIEPLIGFFVNTIALRSNLAGNPSFTDLLGQVKQTTLEAYSYQDVPFDKIVNRVRKEKDLSRSPIFQVMFNLENNPDISNIRLGDLHISAEPLIYELAKFDLTFQVGETTNGLTVDIEYCADLFSAATITRMMDHFRTLLSSVISNPAGKIAGMQMLTPVEERQLRLDFNNTNRDYHRDKTVADLFREKARELPGQVAVVFEGREMTYGELDRRSDLLAHYLKQKGVTADTLVALCLDRSFDMIIALMGVMKAGGAYVPVDPSFPRDRIGYVIEDANAKLIITDRRNVSLLEGREVLLIDGDLIGSDGSISVTGAKPTDLAYVIYTSGSTGRPKGVMIEHRPLVNFLFSMIRTLEVGARSSLLAVTTYSFDISYLELYMPLLTGGKVIIAPQETTSDGYQLKELIQTYRPSHMQATPSTWQLLMDCGWENDEQVVVLTGGEAIREPLKEYLVSLSNRKVWNLYGPTETTIWSTIEELKAGEKITIGRPIANTQIYISNHITPGTPISLAPVGVIGELLIGGDGLARGYWNRQELTAEKFMVNPFGLSGSRGSKQMRLYRTGDLARRLPDGRIECLGRTDAQVKIRGHRIELGEIEAVIVQHEAIEQCAVVAKEDGEGRMRLMAYVVSVQELDKEGLLSYLKSRLPDYMVPYLIVPLKELPLTPNGKVDRKALPNPDASELITHSFTAPRNDIEEQLAEIWKELLHVQKVGVYDNFFELGGHSLLATRVMAACRMRLGMTIPLRILFDFTCIADLANYIRVIKETEGDQQESEILTL